MAGNIIPAIATTNAMTAGLCVLQAFKVLRSDYARARMVFLTRSTDRVISSEPLSAPKPNCPVCGVCYARIEVDMTRATLEDLVEPILKQQLGYEEFSISSEAGGLYDPDFEDNLMRKLSNLGINGSTFLTIMDEGDEDTRVNLVLSISEKEFPEDEKPISLPDEIEIPRKTVSGQAPALPNGTNGHGNADTIVAEIVAGTKRKRDNSGTDADAEGVVSKVSKKEKIGEDNGHSQMMSGNSKLEALVLGDEDDGAIMIDD